MGSDTFSIPNEVRPHCAGGRVTDASLPYAISCHLPPEAATCHLNGYLA
jgi:hypothetical protein